MELSVVPVFQSEIVPKSVRGLSVGTYQMSIQFGGMVINWVCRGTSDIQDNRAWRIPLGLFYIVPTIVLSLIWLIPEVSIIRKSCTVLANAKTVSLLASIERSSR